LEFFNWGIIPSPLEQSMLAKVEKLLAPGRTITLPHILDNVVSLAPLFPKWCQRQSPPNHVGKSKEHDHPCQGHYFSNFSNFSQHGLARGGLGGHFGKSVTKEKTLT